jgi:2-polyprenyl-6-methoxyphenol hydroxylase-like FAD-dependent oxidoreductase
MKVTSRIRDRQIVTEVLIVGAGPVGMMLAIELAQRGIEATVVDSRARGELPGVKCNHVAVRTMEIFKLTYCSRL